MAKPPDEDRGRQDDLSRLRETIKQSSEELDKLMVETTKRKNVALDEEKFELARRFDELFQKYTLQQMVLTRAELKIIDNSQEIKNAIDGFDSIAKEIKATIEQNKEITEFFNAAASIAGIMDRWIGLVLLAA